MEVTAWYQDDSECPLESFNPVTFEELEQLYTLQRDILEGVALGSDYITVLNQLCTMAEKMVPDSLASIMMLDDANKLQVLTAPSIPEMGLNALNNLEPGPHAGSCGNTVYRQSPTFVSNVLTDEKWKNLHQLAKDFGLGACWSMPVRVQAGEIVGTFALTSFQPSSPNIFQRRLLDTCAYIVGIVVRRLKSEEALAYRVNHDALTGLPNREQLENDVNALILNNSKFDLVICGLNRFKSINDSHGHDVGDKVLVEVAIRLNSLLSQCNCQLYRVGGDEFIFVAQKNCSEFRIEELEGKVKSVFMEPVQIENLSFYLSVSSGVSSFNPEEPTTFYTLMKQADMAMYVSKSLGGQELVAFKPEMSVNVEDTLALEGELHEAIKDNCFEVYYQPIVNGKTNRIENLEALIRWNHPVKGVISPLKFIYIAEEMGVIQDITKLVLQTVLSDLEFFDKVAIPNMQVSINISGKGFNQAPIDELLNEIVNANRAAQIEFELTENYIMSHAEDALLLLANIRQSGISLAIDDFGTGYSSLSYLKKFSVDKLKIDQSLIRDLPDDEGDKAIAKAVIALAHSLGLKVVAEGVETERHQAVLDGENIDYLQGYYFAKPQPRTLVIETIKSFNQ
ncbi:MAG: EAL domain-containing protein [Pseudomonadota bacterium]|nr:EAL domain-containing protein [Pseudomonadota bacterium]